MSISALVAGKKAKDEEEDPFTELKKKFKKQPDLSSQLGGAGGLNSVTSSDDPRRRFASVKQGQR